ncbi:Holliday junction branch migration protein RuvA [Patescibacteria group bacterium]|nr:Holliday junction branch migration protein RuvA [Patescibacteria group bacterium]MBU1890602.1 Holliday junction branch migration protein RuvA [Patescibacteria group bacterium]
MIAYLKGTIKLKTDKYIIVEANSVGYRVYAYPDLLESFKNDQTIELYTHQHVSETATELYGFLKTEELNLFEKLITISGVGPKSALSILSLAPVVEIQKAIIHDDPTILTRVSGIGRKTAERIIVELKGVLEKDGLITQVNDQGFLDALEALVQLGYPRPEARRALNKISQDITGTQERVKAALKVLGANNFAI